MDTLSPLIQLIKSNMAKPKLLIIGGLLMVAEAGIALSVPLLTRDFVDQMGSGVWPAMTIALLLGAMTFEALAGAFGFLLLGISGHGIVANLRHSLIGRLVNLPVGFYDHQQSGALASRVVNDTRTLHEIATFHLVSLCVGILTVLGAIGILWMLDWRMTLVLFGGVVLAAVIIGPVTMKIQKITEQVQNETAVFSGNLTNIFREIRLVKAYNAEDLVSDRGAESVESLRRLGIRENAVQAVLSPLVSMSIMGALVVILGYGGARVSAGTLEMGTLIAFILYLFHVAIPITQFSVFFSEIQSAIGSSKNIVALMGEQEERRDGTDQVELQGKAIQLEDLDFAYARPEGDDQEPVKVLQDINLTIPPKQVTALVGTSGSGKTTLLSLLLGFYENQAGRIGTEQQNLSDLQLQAWRGQTAYVAQDAPMINGSVRDNLVFGSDNPISDDAIFAALKAAQMDEVVAKMPQGLDTPIGEHGGGVSGGQRQRLAIARAILRDAPLLMLDEATSHLDTQTEYAVQAALAKLMKSRTTVVVAHRLTTVRDADQIVVFDKGRIVGTGTHDELMADNPVYADLVAHQFKTRHHAAEVA